MADATIIADALYGWMEENLSDYNVGFEYLPATEPALMLQSAPEQPVAKRYKSGREIYIYRFSLLMRASNEDTASRVNAQAALEAASIAIEGAQIQGFDIWEIRTDSTARVISTEDRFDVLMVQMHVTYEGSGA